MDLSVTTGFPDFSALRQARNTRAYAPEALTLKKETQDNLPVALRTPPSTNSAGTTLVNETNENLADGFRRTQVYERADGRQFTRIEDLSITQQGARRTVLQQNPSGSITRYEEILDREDTGNFRRTQRFQDEAGEVATQITNGFKVTDPFVLTNGAANPSAIYSPFTSSRGTQLDLTT